MGVISDNTRSRFGRRKPYMVAGGILLMFSMALLWLPVRFQHEFLRAAYVTAAYLLYNTVATVIAVPYSSMSTEITMDFKRRNQVNLTRLVFSLCAVAACTLLPTILFSRLSSGDLSIWTFYFIITLGFGLLFSLPVILAGLFVRERVSGNPGASRFSPAVFIRPLKVRAFRKLLLLYLAQAITMDIVSAVIIYYGLYVVPGVSSTIFLGAFLGMQLLLFPFLSRLVNKVGKTLIYRFGLPLSMASAAMIAFYPLGKSPMGIYILAGLTALGFGGAEIMSWIIFPDVVDLGDLSLGTRITGSFSGAMTFIRKTSSAFAIFLVGTILGFTGFVSSSGGQAEQPAAVILAIRFILLFTFVLLMGGAWFIARSFRLSPELAKRVKYFLDKRQSGEVLTEEEQAEHRAIIKEFG
jgi:GPH family glycoside/pentoside/hexuronide:cation symporter/oligogalacturonide transporter